MSMRTLPLAFINLGGEMLYILDQRLQAPNISEDNLEKGVWSENDRKRVMSDIVGAMFSKTFMDELLKLQLLYSHRTMKTVLTRLAHASILRLNPASMDRLYDLMIMTFKYQVFLCPRPKDLLLISYNHIDTIRGFVKDTPMVLNQVEETHRKIIEVYSSLSEGEFQLLRQTLLTFFQDWHVRVSHFLKSKIQYPNGYFALATSGPVPHGIEVPGLIRSFDTKGREVKRCEFPTAGSYSSPDREGSFGLHGDRVIRLGLNIYSLKDPEETHTSKASSVKQADTVPNPLAKEELNLLARLMGSMKTDHKSNIDKAFRINLFSADEEEQETGAAGEGDEFLFGVINIQAMQDERAASALAQITGQFPERQQPENPRSNRGDELLAMMDDLSESHRHPNLFQ